jgi:hypothetical protein
MAPHFSPGPCNFPSIPECTKTVPSSLRTAPTLRTLTPDPPPSGSCSHCGYDLRGITSPVCPECGCPIPIQTPLSPQQIDSILAPPIWPIRAIQISMILMILIQAVLLSRALLGMFLLLVVYCSVMFPYWRRIRRIRKISKKHAIKLPIRPEEKSMIWQTRWWFAIALFLTWFEIPQMICIAIESPWIESRSRQLYEVEPLLAQHEWHRCGIHAVTNLDVSPSGVFFDLGLKQMAYGDFDPEITRETYGWHHIVGKLWYHESPDDFFYPWPWPTLNR